MNKIFIITSFFILTICVNAQNRKSNSLDSTKLSLKVEIDSSNYYQTEKIKSEIKNQTAQAKYNESITGFNWNQFGTIIGSILTGFFALTIALYNNRTANNKLEKERIIFNDTKEKERILEKQKENEKSIALKKDERTKEARLAAAKLFENVAEGYHRMTWILWIARFTEKQFDYDLTVNYNKHMNEIYAKISANQVFLAAHNKQLYLALEPYWKELYQHDADINLHFPLLLEEVTLKSGTETLGAKWAGITEHANDLPKKFADEMEKIIPFI